MLQRMTLLVTAPLVSWFGRNRIECCPACGCTRKASDDRLARKQVRP